MCGFKSFVGLGPSLGVVTNISILDVSAFFKSRFKFIVTPKSLLSIDRLIYGHHPKVNLWTLSVDIYMDIKKYNWGEICFTHFIH